MDIGRHIILEHKPGLDGRFRKSSKKSTDSGIQVFKVSVLSGNRMAFLLDNALKTGMSLSIESPKER